MDPKNVKQVAVIGAGVMGHSIAQVFAQAGILVYLVDLKDDLLARGLELVKSNLQTLADYGRVSAQEIPAILDRIRPTTDLAAAIREVDFVQEAVAEIPEVKRKVFLQLEAACRQDIALASNTSGLDIFKIIEVKDPSRVVVAHWFAPPHIIPLVEVVPGPSTGPGVLQFAAGLMERIGKKPLVMKQFVRRFIVNRIQNAIVRTALEMVTNGWATPEQVDLAVKTSLGIRLPIVGVVQSLDFTGLNLIHDITKGTAGENPLIEERVRQGHLGVSTAKGIYDYGGRTEEEILRKRDLLYLKMLDFLETLEAFKPV
ncbi:MAG TPA: 3-hydroxyacyl-CoA dehydrogenase family protein [Thermodesulfobacteriota bacterium]|nr:3-hydroxyacyl-CoA dehydrogenase family protein [Thermodesulfobacteriota bacterium]